MTWSSASRRIRCNSATAFNLCSGCNPVTEARLDASSNSRMYLCTFSTSASMFSGAHGSGVLVMVEADTESGVLIELVEFWGLAVFTQADKTSIRVMQSCDELRVFFHVTFHKN